MVNCAAIPYSLLESELFGYEEGAFTGAKRGGQLGKFELAEGGTVFLDEINSMPVDMQVKILRTLQEKTVVRVGGKEAIPLNVRIIAASNSDLWEKVINGEFREDLFYRINVITILIPPLRERKDDIELLVRHFIKELSQQVQVEIKINDSAVEILKQYSWPGNVRELENVLERSFVMARARGSKSIDLVDVLSYPGIKNNEEQMNKKKDTNLSTETTSINVDSHNLESVERKIIRMAMMDNNANITKTAQALGIGRNTLYRKIKRYGIEIKP